MTKNIGAAVCLALLGTVFAGCSSFQYDAGLFTNDEWIAKEGDTYSYVRRSFRLTPSELDFTFTGFSGKHTVWMIDSRVHASLPFTLNFTDGPSGLYKICFVSPDREVRVLADMTGSASGSISLTPGRQYITLVGHKAAGSAAVRLLVPSGEDGYAVREIR